MPPPLKGSAKASAPTDGSPSKRRQHHCLTIVLRMKKPRSLTGLFNSFKKLRKDSTGPVDPAADFPTPSEGCGSAYQGKWSRGLKSR